MQKQGGCSFVIEGAGTSLLSYSFDDERDEMTVTCPGCGCSFVSSAQSGAAEATLEHEHDCRLLALIESLENHGVPHVN